LQKLFEAKILVHFGPPRTLSPRSSANPSRIAVKETAIPTNNGRNGESSSPLSTKKKAIKNQGLTGREKVKAKIHRITVRAHARFSPLSDQQED
jgi:hypothetical protein